MASAGAAGRGAAWLAAFEELLADRLSIMGLGDGGARLMQGACGYRCTMVSGRVTWRDGQPTGALPGKLVRGMRVAAATVDKGG